MIRDDISSKLIHLTRGESIQEARQNFENILKTSELIGSDKDIRGGEKCICFSEAPISKLAAVLAQGEKMRYAPLGVIVDKKWIYSLGGRPAIYQSNKEFDLLPNELKYRHVRYDPDKEIDYSWEREWRLKADKLQLKNQRVTYIIPSRSWSEKIIGDHDRWVSLMSITHMPMMDSTPGPFLILEDLGVPFQNEYLE